jgi:hypothetical protein
MDHIHRFGVTGNLLFITGSERAQLQIRQQRFNLEVG